MTSAVRSGDEKQPSGGYQGGNLGEDMANLLEKGKALITVFIVFAPEVKQCTT